MLAYANPDIAPLRVPRFVSAGPELAARWGAPAFVVVAPGEAAGVELKPGDTLITGGVPKVGDVVMLVPRRRGRPMLGRLTRRGLVAEPGGALVKTERWQSVGRIAVRVRPEPQAGGPRVLHFPNEAEAEQQALPLTASAEGAAGKLRVALKIEGAAEPRLQRLLAQRLPELREVSEGLLIGRCGPAFAKAPMALAESLVVELRARFGVDLRVVVGLSEELALSVVERLEPGAAAVARATPVAMELPTEPAPQPRDRAPLPTVEREAAAPRRQLGLWG